MENQNLEKELTIEEKLHIVESSELMIETVKMLTAVFIDCELTSHIRFTYDVLDGQQFEITFMPVGTTLDRSKFLEIDNSLTPPAPADKNV